MARTLMEKITKQTLLLTLGFTNSEGSILAVLVKIFFSSSFNHIRSVWSFVTKSNVMNLNMMQSVWKCHLLVHFTKITQNFHKRLSLHFLWDILHNHYITNLHKYMYNKKLLQRVSSLKHLCWIKLWSDLLALGWLVK